MEKFKKTLVLIFGEYRTFNYIAPTWDCLDKDKFDIFIFTPNKTRWLYKNIREVTESEILDIIPHAKVKLHTSYSHENRFHYYYSEFKKILDKYEYDNIIISRIDSTFFIKNLNFEENIIYSDREEMDCLFYGKYDIMKLFINDFLTHQSEFEPSDRTFFEVLQNYKTKYSYTKNPLFNVFYRETMVDSFSLYKNNIENFKQKFYYFYKSGKWARYNEIYNNHRLTNNNPNKKFIK